MEPTTPWRIFHPTSKYRERDAFFDNDCFGSVEGQDGRCEPTVAQGEKNHFEDLLLNGYSVEQSYRIANLVVHKEDRHDDGTKLLKWLVLSLSHNARLAIVYCDEERKLVMCRAWDSAHKPRDKFYEANFHFYENSMELTRKAPNPEL